MMSDNEPNIQQDQAQRSYVRQHINEAHEAIWDDKADPAIQPKIQLKEGWQDGNIHFDTVAPINPLPDPIPTGYPHTWDIWCVVASVGSGQWEQITELYVRVPT